jgi:hypothetical protein
MPIQEDIMDDEVLGPAIRKGRAEGQMELLLGLIADRFGDVPPRVRKRLAELNPDEIKATGRRLLKAQRIQDLLGKTPSE